MSEAVASETVSEVGTTLLETEVSGFHPLALYTKTDNDIEIVEPKAHGLGYFYPPKDSPEGWKHETPQWIFEAWDWIIRGVLGLKRQQPHWFELPVMMKLTLSTPHHALKNLAKGQLLSEFKSVTI